jgi:hypothetical protein
MFGEVSIIEKILEKNHSESEKINRIFFTGSLFYHNDEQLGYIRERFTIYNKIINIIYNPGRLGYTDFLKCIRESKYSLDLNGVGDPNKRTFEILSQGSLMISEYNDLKWPFNEEFYEETIFKTPEELILKINNLENNQDLYKKCLENQQNIFNKYFNIEWIKKYIKD